MERFMSWFLANGGYLSPSAEISTDDKDQNHVRVRLGHTILESETLVSCPHDLVLSYASFHRGDPEAKTTQIDITSYSQDISLRLLLMEQYLLGKDSFWWPYISILPQPFQQHAKTPPEAASHRMFHTPVYFDEEDMLWLNGTNLGVAAKQRVADWRKEFETVKNAITSFDKCKQDLWSSDLFIWAATVITSRSFSSSVLRIPGLDSPVLIPGVDLLDHSPSAKVTWDWGVTACAVQTDVQLTSGNQIFNNYGPKSNEELLMGYGFCLESNQADSFNLSYSPALSQHIDTAKARRKDSSYTGHQSETPLAQPKRISSATLSMCEDMQSPTHPRSDPTPLKDIKFVTLAEDDYRFSPGFLADCSLALLNGRERNQGMACAPHDYKFSTESISRNKLHTLCTIMMILHEKRADIRRHDHSLPPTPRTQNQQYASIYRSSQLRILDGVLACLSSTLQSITQLKVHQQPRIVHLSDILTHHLPKSLKPHFREVVHAGLGSRDPHKVAQRRGVEFAFAVWLCGLRLLHQSGDLAAAEPVLDRWIGFLCAHYDAQAATEDTKSWLARVATASSSSDAQEVVDTAGSYVKAVEAAVEKHPESIYKDEWALGLSNLMWCLVAAREERVRCPTVTESGMMGEEDDEFVLVIDLEDTGQRVVGLDSALAQVDA